MSTFDWTEYFKRAESDGVPATKSLRRYINENPTGTSARTVYTKAREFGFDRLIGDPVVTVAKEDKPDESFDHGSPEASAAGPAGVESETEQASAEGAQPLSGAQPVGDETEPAEIGDSAPVIQGGHGENVDSAAHIQSAPHARQDINKKSDEPSAVEPKSVNFARYGIWAAGGLLLLGIGYMAYRLIKRPKTEKSAQQATATEGVYPVELASPYASIPPYWE